jgi:homoserine O-acetyltransferase
MDSHNIARGRGNDVKTILQSIHQRTLIIGITTDILCPLVEQKSLTENMPHATFIEIASGYGHDGFMVESGQISTLLAQWLPFTNLQNK